MIEIKKEKKLFFEDCHNCVNCLYSTVKENVVKIVREWLLKFYVIYGFQIQAKFAFRAPSVKIVNSLLTTPGAAGVVTLSIPTA